MILPEKDGRLFYELWLPIMEYANRKKRIAESFAIRPPRNNYERVMFKTIADEIWADVSIIDRYVDDHPQLSEDNRRIILSWKRRVPGPFIAERYTKNGIIFISPDTENVYMVTGIMSEWKEMLGRIPLPVKLETTLIPFRDVLIYDGLMMLASAGIDEDLKNRVSGMYMNAKKAGRIIKSL